MTREWVLPVAGGLAAGFVAGLFGVGGGVLLVPILVLLLHRTQHVAHATSLVAIVIPAAVGATRFALDGSVAWLAAAIVAAGSLVGVQAGARLLTRIDERRLRWLFAGLLALMTIRLLIAGDASGGGGAVPAVTAADAVGLGVVGLVTGTASALLGIGGGAIIVPALVILFGFGQHAAEGTSLAIILPTALLGAITHTRAGYTEWDVGVRLGLGGFVGALGGAELALNLPSAVLSRAFAVLLGLVTILLVRRSVGDGAAPESEIEIRPVAADNADDVLAFFDDVAFPEGHEWSGCYCYFDRFPGTDDDWDPTAADRNRSAMERLLAAGLVRGWLAYDAEQPVAWCSAASRVELPHLKVDAPTPRPGTRIGVVNCFVIAPSHRGRGLARMLLDAAVEAFTYQGMDAVEAYPIRADREEERSHAYRGRRAMLLDAGFVEVATLEHRVVMRRELSHPGRTVPEAPMEEDAWRRPPGP